MKILLASLCVMLANTLLAQEFVPSIHNLAANDAGRVQWADLDNDSDLDLIYFGVQGTWVYSNDNGKFSEEANTGLPYFWAGDFALGDYDSDGDSDILLSGAQVETEGLTGLYKNNGGFQFELVEEFPWLVNTSISWVDLDNDTDLDFVLSGNRNLMEFFRWIYRNDGGGTFTQLGNGNLPVCFQCSIDWADINDDQLPDVVLTGLTDNFGTTSGIFLNIGNFSFVQDASASLPALFNGSAQWGDFDGDNDYDIILTGGSNVYESHLYENKGVEWNERSDIAFTPVTDSFMGGVRWADLNKDGRLDLLLGGRGGSNTEPIEVFKYYRNTGLQTFDEVTYAGFDDILATSVDYGDYDNDGDLDVVYMGLRKGVAIVEILDNVLRRPKGKKAEIVDGNSARISWQDNSHEELSYKVERSEDSNDSFQLLTILPANSESFHDQSNMLKETYYYYRFYAADNNRTSLADTLMILIPAAPASLTTASIDATTLSLTWQDNSSYETAYAIDRKISGTTIFEQVLLLPPNTTHYTDTGLAEDTSYDFSVRCVNEFGSSSPSNTSTAKTNDRPDAENIDISTPEDEIFAFLENQFLEVFSDNDITDLQVKILLQSLPSRGDLFLSGTKITEPVSITSADINQLTYQPDKDVNGIDGFLFRPHDGKDSSNVNYNVSLNVMPVNDPPQISEIPDFAFENFTAMEDISFTINDVDNPIVELSVSSVTSSNEILIDSEKIMVTGSGLTRVITITPPYDRAGETFITISVTDGVDTTTEDFELAILNLVSSEDNVISGIKIFPNPTTDFITVALGSAASLPAQIELHDVEGRLMYQSIQLSRERMYSLNGLPKGIYFLGIDCAGTGKIVTRIINR